MKSELRSAVSTVFTIGYTGLLSPVVIGLSLVNERAMDPVLHRWGVNVLKASGVRTEVRGLENLPEGNFVMACNHLSNFDPLVLFAHIRRHLRFVAKAELLKVPLMGAALRSAGNIFIDRRGGPADRELLQASVKAVRERVSICFFAEGTRAGDGALAPFKKGAAIMALEAQVPLVPAAIAGTHQILRKGTLAVHAHPAVLMIGKPLPTEGLGVDARDSLTQQAYAQVVQLLAEGEARVEELKREDG